MRGVPGAQRLDLGKGKRRFVHVIAGAHRRFGGHNLADEFLLVLHRLPEVGVESALGDVAVHMDSLVLVALALNAALSLGQVAGPPRAVQVMQCHQAVLDVGARAHFGRAAQQDAHLAGADLGEQLLFAHFGVSLMDKGNLLGGHALGDEFLPDVLIDRKGRFRLVQRHRVLQSVEGRVVQRLRHLFGGRAWGVEMSQNTSWVSLSASPSRQICMILSTHWLTLVPGSSGSSWLMIRSSSPSLRPSLVILSILSWDGLTVPLCTREARSESAFTISCCCSVGWATTLWYSTWGVGRCSWSAVLMSATSLKRFISSGRLKNLEKRVRAR